MIPKIIWQTHEYEIKDLPDEFKTKMNSWKEMNPTWDYRYTNATERLEHIKNFGGEELLSFYKDCSRVTQSDIWRYIILYEFGGVYSDIDTQCIMPLDQMMDLHYNGEPIIVHRPMLNRKFHFINGNIAAVKNQEVFKEIIESAIKKFRSLPADRDKSRINKTCGSSCCSNSLNGCNGRNDYNLGYEFFSQHLMKYEGSLSKIFHFSALMV